MSLKLTTDFRDFYDVFGDKTGIEFRRMTTEGPDRWEMFKLFHTHWIHTPKFGYGSTVLSWLDPPKLVVVHTDLRAHQGEGKLLMPAQEAFDKHPNDLVVEYAHANGRPSSLAISRRMLLVGSKGFLLEYCGEEDWRSNVGEGNVTVRSSFTELHPGMWTLQQALKAPLLAVDFVSNGKAWLAIDLNIAPQLNGTGVQHHLSAGSVVGLIEEFLGAALFK